MIYVKKAGEPARDLNELNGDPWASGILSDAPDLNAVNHDLEAYDRWVDAQAAGAGVLPGTEAYEAVTQAIRQKDMVGGDVGLMQHGHQLPMQRREYLEYTGGTQREVLTAQDQFADDLYAEYAQRWPELAQDTDGLSAAIDYEMAELRRRGENVRNYVANHREDFLRDISTWHYAGVGRYSRDTEHGRTAGIGGSGGGYSEPSSTDRSHPYDSEEAGMISEIRDLQRKRGLA